MRENEYDSIKVIFAVTEIGDALIVGYSDCNDWLDEGVYAVDNGFLEQELPKEPGIYNCDAQPYWEGEEDNGELLFTLTGIEKVAKFEKGEAARVFRIERSTPLPMPQEMIDQLKELSEEDNQ